MKYWALWVNFQYTWGRVFNPTQINTVLDSAKDKFSNRYHTTVVEHTLNIVNLSVELHHCSSRVV